MSNHCQHQFAPHSTNQSPDVTSAEPTVEPSTKIRVKAGMKSKWLVLVVILAASGFGCAGSRWSRPRLPDAAEAVRHIDATSLKPVPDEILARNPQRRSAGLRELPTGCQIAPTKYIICDGPFLEVIVNEQHQPILVISQFGDRGIGPVLTESEVRNGALHGLAVTWWGTPPRLYETATYRQNRRDGPTVYFGTNGAEIARCDYRQDEPWTGRQIQRHGVAPVIWDVSYRDGKLDGAEVMYETDGTTNRLRTFRGGIEHGVARSYHQGVLRSEEMLDNGRRVSHRSWYPNGQLEWSESYDDRARQHGIRRHWDTNGVLRATERYEHGREIR
jgi:hypothetical protein